MSPPSYTYLSPKAFPTSLPPNAHVNQTNNNCKFCFWLRDAQDRLRRHGNNHDATEGMMKYSRRIRVGDDGSTVDQGPRQAQAIMLKVQTLQVTKTRMHTDKRASPFHNTHATYVSSYSMAVGHAGRHVSEPGGLRMPSGQTMHRPSLGKL